MVSQGICDFEGDCSKKSRRSGMRHFYVMQSGCTEPFTDAQIECDQLALYVRNHVLLDFVMDSPNPKAISALPRLCPSREADQQLTFEEAREKLGHRVPGVTPPALVTDLGASKPEPAEEQHIPQCVVIAAAS